MFRNSCQRGRLTVFYSVGAKPLNNWETHVKGGYITRFLDPDIKSMVLEIGGVNVSTTYMICPAGNKVLGITMPFLIMVVKNMKKYFTFEITILDETGTRRRFRVANFQSQTQILPLSTVMPINLTEGWNQIQFNLNEFTRRAYNKHFVEVQKIKINANIRLRRIYFAEKIVSDEELPAEFKIFFPLNSGPKMIKKPSVTAQADGKDAKRKSNESEVNSIVRQPSTQGRDSKVENKASNQSVSEKLQEQLIKRSLETVYVNKEVTQIQIEKHNISKENSDAQSTRIDDKRVSLAEVEKDESKLSTPPASSVKSNTEVGDNKNTPEKEESNLEDNKI